ncbi:bifunctional methionine sulfoxide reductase B/A protein, partial [Sphaerochaeta sp.]
AQAQPQIEETMATTQQRFTFQPLDQSLKNTLNAQESQVIINKGTERAFTGAYTDTEEEGTYYCRWCNSPLYSSQSKFHSGCGWPSFDDEIPNAVLRYPDADGSRTEIVCATCQGHLGHVFTGERFTEKNTRHCVNSISLVFRQETPVAEAVFAGGCFWGVEHLFEQKKGVYSAVSGYTGGTLADPTYQDVLTHTSGHLEAVKVYYNPLEVSYEELAKFFFEIHDPTQTDGQGPDIGNQYLSAVFYRSRSEFDTAVRLIEILEAKGLKIATTLRGAAIFYPAEEYHQDYYVRKGSQPYCHAWVKRF